MPEPTGELELGVKEQVFEATNIPDKSVVTSGISINSQTIGIDYKELISYFQQIKEQSVTKKGVDLIGEAAEITISSLKPGDDKWDEIVRSGEDANYTLGRSIKENVNTCFQRTVFFNLLMQQLGVPCVSLEGRWVESKRSDLKEKVNDVLNMTAGGHIIASSDKSEEHLWNIVARDGKYFLVDTSYLIEKDGKQKPVIQEIEYEKGGKYFRVPLPSGKTRHYIVDGMVNVTDTLS